MNLLDELKDVEVNEEQLQEIKELLGIEIEWKPKGNRRYWTMFYGDFKWEVFTKDWYNSTVDCKRLEMGIVYKTRDEAQFEVDKRNFLQQMEIDFKNNSDEMDWDKFGVYYFFYYKHDERIVAIGNNTNSEYQLAPLYTTNRNWLKQYIKDNEENIKKYYFGIKGDKQ